jgi:NTE family protein
MKNFGLVLSGGGAKGAYQIGVMKAIKEFDININSYSGSSIGGLNEVLLFTNPIETCQQIWKDISFSDFFSLDDDIFNGLSDRNGLLKIINNVIDFSKIQNSQIPLFVTICTDETTKQGRYVLLNNKSKEDIIDLLLATSALPIIYDKVNYNNFSCLDGGLFDNNPISPLYHNDIKNLIVVSLSNTYSLNKYKYPNSEILVIKPTMDLKGLVEGTLNFNREEILLRMDLGYSDAKRILNNYYGIENKHDVHYDNQLILQDYNINKMQSVIDSRFDYIKKYDV